MLLLGKGDVDMAIEIPPKDVSTLESNSALTVASNASNRILFFAMNNKVKPFDNVKSVRRSTMRFLTISC